MSKEAPHPSELISAERYLHRRLRNRLNDALDGHGFSYAQFELMMLLEDRPNMHAGQIARVLGSARQSVHGLVRKLEAARLVDVDPGSGFEQPLDLTELGRRRTRTAWGVLEATVHTALAAIPVQERRTALEALERCERSLAPLRPPWW